MTRIVFDYNKVKPRNLMPGVAVSMKIVAVVGGSGFDWAAYQGPTSWSDEEVAKHGDKLLKSYAEPLFREMTIAGLVYRR